MTEQGLKYLTDCIFCIDLIEEFIIPISSYDLFLKDIKTRSAIERQLTIIGEAINKYNHLDLDEKIDDSRKIIGFRNRLIHAYDSIDPTIIWAIIKVHLPVFKNEIQKHIR